MAWAVLPGCSTFMCCDVLAKTQSGVQIGCLQRRNDVRCYNSVDAVHAYSGLRATLLRLIRQRARRERM